MVISLKLQSVSKDTKSFVNVICAITMSTNLDLLFNQDKLLYVNIIET